MTLFAILLTLVFLYSLISGVLERTPITAPILFTTAGMLLPIILPEAYVGGESRTFFLHLAEVGLVLLLFTDASRTNWRVLKSIGSLPVRLLSIGMLLTLFLGTVTARILFPQLSIWEAGILAAILAPTDAGLGQVIVNSPLVPLRVRQALNVEAGLNDGLSVPFLLFFLALVQSTDSSSGGQLFQFLVEQLGYGSLIGAGVGLLGGGLLGWANRQKWMAESPQQLGVVALPLLCWVASDHVGASMFIAAFVAGLFVQVGFREVGRHSAEFAEGWGQLLNLSVFFFFGLVSVREGSQLPFAAWVYAVVSLTVVRMVPVACALWGTGLSRASILFMGWFGPRGLASLVLGLVYLEEETHTPGESLVRQAVLATVLLSIYAHGFSALPGIRFYSTRLAALGPEAPENRVVSGDKS